MPFQTFEKHVFTNKNFLIFVKKKIKPHQSSFIVNPLFYYILPQFKYLIILTILYKKNLNPIRFFDESDIVYFG